MKAGVHNPLYKPAHLRSDGVTWMCMHMKRTLAAVLTVLLLSLSGTSSMCQLNCRLHMHMAERPSAPDSSDKTHDDSSNADMAGMGDCGMQKASANSSAVLRGITAHCQHQACTVQPAIPNEQHTSSAIGSIGSTPYVVPDMPSFMESALMQAVPVRGPPPFRPLSPIGLHTTLRV